MAEISYLDFIDLPFFNQDTEFPTSEVVLRIRKEIEEADGLWIFVPEYNSSYPGYVKNLIDWMSRSFELNNYASGTALKGKKVTISGVAGKRAVAGSRAKLYELLQFAGMNVYKEDGEGFAVSGDSFATDLLTLVEDDKERLKKQGIGFVEFC